MPILLASCGGDPDSAVQVSRQAASVTAAAADAIYLPTVHKLYIGYFGRPADPGGLHAFAARLNSLGAPADMKALDIAYRANPAIRELIDSFGTSQESKDLYSEDNGIFMDAAYANLFGRKPDAEGRAFWMAALDRGELTRSNAVLSLLAGAAPDDNTMVGHKTMYAEKFTAALDTPARIAAYSGSAAAALVRALLTDTFLLMTPSMMDPGVAATVKALETAAAADRVNYVDVKAEARRIALVASAEQMTANGARLQKLATALAADLGTRDAAYGPAWTVEVLPAAATAQAIAAQLKGYYGAILVGMLPVPTHAGFGYGEIYALDVYRLPQCTAFEFSSDGNTLSNKPMLYQSSPQCRNGLVLSLLRGRTAAQDVADVAGKLDQMVAYHKNSAAANANWNRSYQYVMAGWFGGLVMDDVTPYWTDVPLYGPDQRKYVTTGSAQERMAAFRTCLAGSSEMCVFNGHGLPTLIQAEGPGKLGETYSNDVAYLNSADILPQSVDAKYISLVSCSTQDTGGDNGLGTVLLMSGKTLLTHGMNEVTGFTSRHEEITIKAGYHSLAQGGTIADGYWGEVEEGPTSFQGDPFITMRPVPGGDLPKLVIDGKRYHGGTLLLPLALPDSVGRVKSFRTLVVTNPGKADLKIRLGNGVRHNGVDANGSGNVIGVTGGGAGLELSAPILIVPERYSAAVTDTAFTIKPGEALPLTYSLQPMVKPGGAIYEGTYHGRIEILSNDPAAARVYLELSGKVREH